MKTPGKILAFCVIVGLGVLLYTKGCGVERKSNAKGDKKAVPVGVTRVTRATVEEAVHTKGTLHALEEATISPKLPGKIARILVDEGDEVRAGQVVAELEDTQFVLAEKRAQQGLLQAQAGLAQSRAGIAQADANFQNTKADYDRMEGLYAKQSIARQKYDHALTGFRMAEAGLRQARALQELAQAQVAQAKVMIDLAKTQLADTKIVSPITGTVTKRSMNLGEMASPGKAIFIVECLNVLELKADVSSLMLGRLKVGMPVRVDVDGIDDTIHAKIDEISPRVDKKLRTVEVTLGLDNKDRTLRPGLFARVGIILEERSDVVAIPKDVLIRRDGEVYVFRLNGDLAERTPVTVGIRHGGVVEIKQGLNEGDVIVAAGQNNLQGGEKVNIREERK